MSSCDLCPFILQSFTEAGRDRAKDLPGDEDKMGICWRGSSMEISPATNGGGIIVPLGRSGSACEICPILFEGYAWCVSNRKPGIGSHLLFLRKWYASHSKFTVTGGRVEDGVGGGFYHAPDATKVSFYCTPGMYPFDMIRLSNPGSLSNRQIFRVHGGSFPWPEDQAIIQEPSRVSPQH